MAPRNHDVPPPENVARPARRPRADDARASGERAGHLAFVAHEMRNPLATALWSAELLTRLSPEDRAGARGEKLAGMCLRTLVRLRHLVEDHFLSERLAIHGLPVRIEPTPVAEVIATAISRVPGIHCDTEIDPAMTVHADRAMLERALEALLASAARAQAPVRVTAAAEENLVTLEVRGSPPPEDAFRLPDRSTPSDPTGRALGLLMAGAVASVHHGSLEALDDGFALVLPGGESGAVGDDR